MKIIYILISCLLCFLSFPKFSFWGLSFIALIPFFSVLNTTDSFFKQVAYGILWSVCFASLMGYWVFSTLLNYYEVPFVKAVLFFILCLIIPVVLIYGSFILLYRFMFTDTFFFHALIVPSLWVMAEYLKELISFMIPWGNLGYALIPFTEFIQIADVVGGYGVTFIVVMINAILLYFFRHFPLKHSAEKINNLNQTAYSTQKKVQIWFPLLLCGCLIGIPMMYGKYRLNSINSFVRHQDKPDQYIHAALIQGNFSLKERWSGMGFYHRIKGYLEMTGGGEGVGERVVVWPETTLNSSTKVNDALFMELMRYIGKDSLLISGGLKKAENKNDIFNCAYFISGQGHLTRYDKHILLPYSETSPLIDLLDPYYTAPSEFKEGGTPVSIETPFGHVGASICFEILYPGFIRQSVKDGAKYLVNISNDSWFGDSPMPYAHLDGARLRAIENRRFLLRTSNSGISAIISPSGKVLAQSRLFTKERVDGKFLKLEQLSFYTRYGNLVIYGAALLLLIALAQIIIKD